MCNASKIDYAGLPNERKDIWKANIRRNYPTKDDIIAQHERIKKEQHREKKLGVLFTLSGNRGRTITVCKNKCIIKTDVTVGSVLTGNATDGEKIISKQRPRRRPPGCRRPVPIPSW